MKASSRANRPGVLIVGAGLAAQRCCEALRRKGYEGRIRIVGDEPERPYDRPPLSKEMLAGAVEEEALSFRPLNWYEQHGVELLLGHRAVRLDPGAHEVELEGGRALRYDQLLIATGSAPRRLPPAEGFDNVHLLRTVADARALRKALWPGVRLAVIGAGFIGQEVAATARALGAEVTIVEALEAPLVNILGAELGHWFARLHREEGVEVLLSAMVSEFRGDGRIEELVLADGRHLECDVVVVGIGVAPATAWLEGSGLDPEGVAVDAGGRSGLPEVYAAGDAARPFDERLGRHVRTEHWEVAARQGAAAAAAMLGQEPAGALLPSFWSDQHGVRIQYLGHADGADRVTVEGDPAGRDFTATFERRGLPVAALLVGRPHALSATRKQIESALADAAPAGAAQDAA